MYQTQVNARQSTDMGRLSHILPGWYRFQIRCLYQFCVGKSVRDGEFNKGNVYMAAIAHHCASVNDHTFSEHAYFRCLTFRPFFYKKIWSSKTLPNAPPGSVDFFFDTEIVQIHIQNILKIWNPRLDASALPNLRRRSWELCLSVKEASCCLWSQRYGVLEAIL